jgi:putative transposase
MSGAGFGRSAGGVASLGLRVVWCPRYRRRLLGGRLAVRMNELLDEIAAENGWEIVAREVVLDHVPILVRVAPSDWPAEVARRFKGRTSRVLRVEFPWLGGKKVLWSKSYFAASVGSVCEQTVCRYIEHRWDDAG